MKLDEADLRADSGENIIPMINVVFLLLIFFLMTAQIAPPEPFEVTPPEASSDTPAEGPLTLHLDTEGTPGFRDLTGDAALDALATEIASACAGAACPEPPTLLLRADEALPGARLAALLPGLAAAGVGELQIVTTRK